MFLTQGVSARVADGAANQPIVIHRVKKHSGVYQHRPLPSELSPRDHIQICNVGEKCDTLCSAVSPTVKTSTTSLFSSQQVLERVARVYPRALFYPLLITKTSTAREQLEGKAGTAGGVHGGRLGKLTALTFDPSAEAFAEVECSWQSVNMRIGFRRIFHDFMWYVCNR